MNYELIIPRTEAGKIGVITLNRPPLDLRSSIILVPIAQAIVALPLVVPPVTYTGAADTARPVVSPVVLAQVTVVLPVPLPAAFVTTFVSVTVLPVQSSVKRVFHVVPLSGDTWKAHWLFGEILFRSRVCT